MDAGIDVSRNDITAIETEVHHIITSILIGSTGSTYTIPTLTNSIASLATAASSTGTPIPLIPTITPTTTPTGTAGIVSAVTPLITSITPAVTNKTVILVSVPIIDDPVSGGGAVKVNDSDIHYAVIDQLSPEKIQANTAPGITTTIADIAAGTNGAGTNGAVQMTKF